MIGTTAAALGAAALGTAGNLISGSMGAKAANQAASVQAQAANQAAQLQRDSATQSRIDAYPWALEGAQALYTYMDEIGIPRPQTPILPDLTAGPFGTTGGGTLQGGTSGSASGSMSRAALGYDQRSGFPTSYAAPGMTSEDMRNGGTRPTYVSQGMTSQQALGQQQGYGQQQSVQQPSYTSANQIPMTEKKGFQETPGYQFMVDEGEKGVLNNLAALGMKDSGAALKALTRYRSGVANQTYDNWLNRIASSAGMGQQQVNTTNALSQNAATNVGQYQQDAGAARASGYMGASNAMTGALGKITNDWSNVLGRMSAKTDDYSKYASYGTTY